MSINYKEPRYAGNIFVSEAANRNHMPAIRILGTVEFL